MNEVLGDYSKYKGEITCIKESGRQSVSKLCVGVYYTTVQTKSGFVASQTARSSSSLGNRLRAL